MGNFDTYALVLVIVMGLVTFGTRVVPFLLFGQKETVPAFILYLGDVLPYASMGLLVVYCLKDVSFVSGSYGVPELIGLATVTATYLWKRNTILSIVVSTALYMFLVQIVF